MCAAPTVPRTGVAALRVPVPRQDRRGTARPRHGPTTYSRGNPAGAAPVAIIDERIARAMWPGQSAIGQRARIPIGKAPWIEVVGVVGHSRHDGLEIDPRPQVYFNDLERVQDRMTLVVRSGNVAALGPLVRRAIHDVDPDQPISDLRTMDDVVGRSPGEWS